MGVSKNSGTPQIIHWIIGFGTIIFTIHFGFFSPYFWRATHMISNNFQTIQVSEWKISHGTNPGRSLWKLPRNFPPLPKYKHRFIILSGLRWWFLGILFYLQTALRVVYLSITPSDSELWTPSISCQDNQQLFAGSVGVVLLRRNQAIWYLICSHVCWTQWLMQQNLTWRARFWSTKNSRKSSYLDSEQRFFTVFFQKC